MSQENVEIDRQAVEAFNRHDFEAWLEHFDRTITWWAMTHEPEPGPFQGHEGVSKMAARWLDLLPDLRVEVKEYIDAGEYLVVPVRICGHAPDSGADVVGEEVFLNKYRDGKIIEVREYRTREEALEALGLSERAMSQENVESFKRGLEAGNRGDVEMLLEELDPEVEWHSALHALMGGEQTVFRGHDGVREMLRDLNEAFGEIHIEISEIRDLGNRLVAIGHNRARGRGSGAETETPLALVTEVKNGKTISVRGYLDPKQALEAVGLSEQDAHADS